MALAGIRGGRHDGGVCVRQRANLLGNAGEFRGVDRSSAVHGIQRVDWVCGVHLDGYVLSLRVSVLVVCTTMLTDRLDWVLCQLAVCAANLRVYQGGLTANVCIDE